MGYPPNQQGPYGQPGPYQPQPYSQPYMPAPMSGPQYAGSSILRGKNVGVA